jgi:AcrR family transcriptional regulator
VKVIPVTPSQSQDGPIRRRDPLRKQKILAAAADLVGRRGFHAVSMADIGDEVGISGAAIYRHFENKSALLVALFDQAIDELLDDERATLRDSPSDEAALRHLIEGQVNFVVLDRAFARVYHHEVDHLPEVDRERLRHKQRLYLQEWVRLVQRLHVDLDEAGARTLVHAAIGAIQSPLFHQVTLPEARLNAELVRLACAVVGLAASDLPVR